jgi:hypothetical protein
MAKKRKIPILKPLYKVVTRSGMPVIETWSKTRAEKIAKSREGQVIKCLRKPKIIN